MITINLLNVCALLIFFFIGMHSKVHEMHVKEDEATRGYQQQAKPLVRQHEFNRVFLLRIKQKGNCWDILGRHFLLTSAIYVQSSILFGLI
jgi:hypothetical protein